VHLSHPNNEGSDEVEASLLTPTAAKLVLGDCIVARNFGYWRKEKVSTIREPVDLSLSAKKLGPG